MIQIVFVKWGTKYPKEHVNGLWRTIRARSGVELAPVVITDDGAGLDPEIRIAPFPDLGLPDEMLAKGCLRKLSMFSQGVLEPGAPALYLDLDTAIFGDVQKLIDCLIRDRGLYMLSNHFIQTWKWRSLIKSIAPENYYFGNSSLVAYYPEDYYFIPDQLRDELPGVLAHSRETDTRKPMAYRSDERFMSFAARDTVRVFPDKLAARFQDAYMAPSFWLADMRDRLPSIQSRRAARVALTFSGQDNKPERLLSIADGTPIQRGALRTRWRYPELKQYWVDVSKAGQAPADLSESPAIAKARPEETQ